MIKNFHEICEWLKQETLELLDAGAVGLYELVWSLRGDENAGLTDADRIVLAKQVAMDILDTETVELYRLRWAKEDNIIGPISLTDVTKEEWLAVPDSGEYAALVPTD